MTILSVNLLLDEETEEEIRLLQQSTAPEGTQLPSGYPPHITLTAYQISESAEAEYLPQLPLLAQHRQRFPLLLESLGIFPEAGVLFLAPRMSSTLLSIHQASINQFKSPVLDEFLLPDRWTPHVTIAGSRSTNHLLSVLAKVLHSWRPIRGEVVGIGMRIHPAATHSDLALFAM